MLLGIYLNDHLAGATGGVELARRAAGGRRGTPLGDELERLARELAENRKALLEIMAALRVPVRQYKVYAAWAAEKAGRLKLNGRLLTRSPLSDVVELEGLLIGVEGEKAAWRTLRALADREERLDAQRIDGLMARSQEIADTLERLRAQAAAEAFALRSPR